MPGLSSGDADLLVHRVLQTSEYESIDLQATLPRPLRAVGITIGHGDNAGGSTSLNVPANYTGFGGWFDKMVPGNDLDLKPPGAATLPDARYKEGLIMFKEGTKWLSNFVSNHAYTPRSTGIEGTLRTSADPDAGEDPVHPEPKNLLNSAKPVWDLYARAVYIHEVLKNRQGTISGPVRFDIAPGSTIKVEATEDKFVKHVVFEDIQSDKECESKYFKYYWCSVLRVSTTIDCQNMKAATNFYVAHFRNRDENKDVATAIGRHPLWQKCSWAGCVLWEDDAFQLLSAQLCN